MVPEDRAKNRLALQFNMDTRVRVEVIMVNSLTSYGGRFRQNQCHGGENASFVLDPRRTLRNALHTRGAEAALSASHRDPLSTFTPSFRLEISIRRDRKLTIAILVEKGEGLLEFSNLFFGKLISHGVYSKYYNE